VYNWKNISPDRKKELMVLTRRIAYKHARSGFLEVYQKGKPIVNPTEETVKGPIRLKLM
jgi:hypothetical protein